MSDSSLQQPGYFGPPMLRKDYERQVQTPVGSTCLLCSEAVLDGDTGTINAIGQVTHHECTLRAVIGSYGHLTRQCHCYGGTIEDPPGMSRRASAMAAVAEFQRQQREAAAAGVEWAPHLPMDPA